MSGVQKIQGKVKVVLNELVSEGVITSFRTNFDVLDEAPGPVVTVTVPASRFLEDVREHVIEALAAVAIGIDIILDP